MKLIINKELFYNNKPSAKEVIPARVLKNPNPSLGESLLAVEVLRESEDKFNKLFTKEIALLDKEKYYAVYKPHKCVVEKDYNEFNKTGIDNILCYLKNLYIIRNYYNKRVHGFVGISLKSKKNNYNWMITHNDSIQLFRRLDKEYFTMRKLSVEHTKHQENLFYKYKYKENDRGLK